MDFEWVAIALGDVAWIALAFALGFGARLLSLPPLVGFLAAGFVLGHLGFTGGETLDKLADLGITLLLFTVGLKLNVRMLARPHIWAVTVIHIASVVFVIGLAIMLLGLVALPALPAMSLPQALLLAFALSFSSTVFVAKSLEDKGEMKSLRGRVAIGILVMQDIAAVVFLVAATGKLPSPWAPLLLLLWPLRPLLVYFLRKTGHGELLVLYGLVVALGGAELFEMGGVKDDLGALIMGALLASHPKASELVKSMFGFKDLFLVGFFLSIGMSTPISLEAVVIGVLLVPLVAIKSTLFMVLLTRFKLRARTALLATLNLSNFSEFGLIVTAVGVSNAWIASEWLAIVAVALSVSFVLSGALTGVDHRIFERWRHTWLRLQKKERLPDDRLLQTGGATIAVFGMGRVGSGAYARMQELHGDTVVGVDFDTDRVAHHRSAQRNVLLGDPSDRDFWEKIDPDHRIEVVLLALPNLGANLRALEQLRTTGFTGRIGAIARYADEEARLREAGASAVFNFYTEAGAGFADQVEGWTPAAID